MDSHCVATRIYKNTTMPIDTVSCSWCVQRIAIGIKPNFCPNCGHQFDEWQDVSSSE